MTVTNILEAPEALSALRALYLFDGVADDILRSLANKSQVLEFKEGDCIFREKRYREECLLRHPGQRRSGRLSTQCGLSTTGGHRRRPTCWLVAAAEA